jgi:hypothetical protein
MNQTRLYQNTSGVMGDGMILGDKIENLKPNTKYKIYSYIETWSTKMITTYDNTYSNGIYTKVDALKRISNALGYKNESRISNQYYLAGSLSQVDPSMDDIIEMRNVGAHRTRVVLKTNGVHGFNGTDDIIEKGFHVSAFNSEFYVGYSIHMYGVEPNHTNPRSMVAGGGFTMSVPSSEFASFLNGKKYWYRSYWTNTSGTSYGASSSFYTRPIISGNIVFTSTTTTPAANQLLNRVTTVYIQANTISIKNIDVPIESYGLVWSLNNQIPSSVDPITYTSRTEWDDHTFRFDHYNQTFDEFYGWMWGSVGTAQVENLPRPWYESYRHEARDTITVGNVPNGNQTSFGGGGNQTFGGGSWYARLYVRIKAGDDSSNNTTYIWYYSDQIVQHYADPNAYFNPNQNQVVSLNLGTLSGGNTGNTGVVSTINTNATNTTSQTGAGA